MSQTTIKYPIKVYGVGIHSGEGSTVLFHPAPPNTGLVFYRNSVQTPAYWTEISDTRLCTVLGHEAPIMTVEHLMAAVSALQLDNLVIEVQGPEIPILDGSAAEFYFALQSAGCDISQEPAAMRALSAPVRVSRGEAYCELVPSDHLSFDFLFATHPSQCLADYPSFHFRFGEGSFEHEVARARTFGMMQDYPKLKAAGFALGAHEHNAIGLDAMGPVNPEGLRMPDEPARHKVLDAIGDLLLLGPRLHAHFKGYGSGHALHHALMQAAAAHVLVLA